MSEPKDDNPELIPQRPLSETIESPLARGSTVPTSSMDVSPFDEPSTINAVAINPESGVVSQRAVAPGEALQLVRFSRREQVLKISGVTPHGRRLTFEQREDRDGWYVVAAGRRRRPTERELGLVVATIAQEMEASMAPEEDQEEIRSAYRLAASSDQPGIPGKGLQAYRDLLLDEAAAYVSEQVERLGVVAVEYQAFKRFAIRHGHRIGAAFVGALGEWLQQHFGVLNKVHVCHKAGKSFRLIVIERSSEEVFELIQKLLTDDTREWICKRVWGDNQRTHPDEVNFYVGLAMARSSERKSTSYENLAQRLNDDAYRAAKLGQLKGHTSIQMAKTTYRTSFEQWRRTSEDAVEELASQMDEGPAEVMAEMSDFLHELVPADLEGMAVEGNVHALVHKAIARDGFWQGSTAMRIAGERLIGRFLKEEASPEGEHSRVGGFEFGDEFYGIALEGGALYFAWGDLNSAGATRVRAGLELIQHAVGWRREDKGGIVGIFLRALYDEQAGASLPDRLVDAAQQAYAETFGDERMHVNDSVDIAGHLWTEAGELIKSEDLVEGANLILSLPDGPVQVEVLERRANFMLRLSIDGHEHVAAVSESISGPVVKLRIRRTVISSAVCIIKTKLDELEELLDIVREDNNLPEDTHMNILGFLRHNADLLLADQVKTPGKIGLALGASYDPLRFVRTYTLEQIREYHPGLFYEAVHNELVDESSLSVDRHLREVIARTMLARARPEDEP